MFISEGILPDDIAGIDNPLITKGLDMIDSIKKKFTADILYSKKALKKPVLRNHPGEYNYLSDKLRI